MQGWCMYDGCLEPLNLEVLDIICWGAGRKGYDLSALLVTPLEVSAWPLWEIGCWTRARVLCWSGRALMYNPPFVLGIRILISHFFAKHFTYEISVSGRSNSGDPGTKPLCGYFNDKVRPTLEYRHIPATSPQRCCSDSHGHRSWACRERKWHGAWPCRPPLPP